MRNRSRTCHGCLMPQAFCVCRVMERETVETRVTVVVHFSDVCRKTNTGKLIPKVLANSEVLVRGIKGSPLDITRAVQAGYHNVLLYPTSDSQPLNAEYLQDIDQPLNLIVPDGNWNQAGKMVRREKKLASLDRVHVEVVRPSRYRLRTAAHENWISTFEAIARALGVVENHDVQKKLEYFFDVFVERILYLKGRLPRDEVTGGITQEMITQFHTENNDHTFIQSNKTDPEK